MHTEQVTIEAILSGDSDAYRSIVERYHAGLIIHCDQLLRDHPEAEDVAQESFIIAFERLATFDGNRARFSTWLYKIATNKCIDRLRKQKRLSHVEDIETLAETTMPTHADDEDIAWIRHAVTELTPPEFRQVIEMYFWEGKSYQQIAEELQTNTNTIGTWMSRAKSQLREKRQS